MKKAILLLMAVVLMIPLAACLEAKPAAADELKSDKPRETVAVNAPDMAKLTEGNNAFAADLYRVLKDEDGNLFYSPYSISEALAMTYGGARGTTEQQMATALHFLLGQDSLHRNFNSLDQELAKRGQGAKGTDEKGFRLKVVNAIWGQRDFPFQSAYLDLLAQNYGAGLRILDFIKSPEPSREKINEWVSEQTEGKIKDLLPKGSITNLTRMVLTNAIYFNAAWLYQFNEDVTFNSDFNLLNGTKVSVPMMKQMQTYGYASGWNLQAVEMLYDSRELSMVILLPDAGKFSNFESILDGKMLSDILNELEPRKVDLTMPKFKFESQFGLKESLTKLGMVDAFDPNKADLSGMDGKKDLYISDVVHKAYVAVDEKGTEAAAATGVIVGTTSMPTDIVNLILDRPFIFLIRDVNTGAILFVGRVLNPAE